MNLIQNFVQNPWRASAFAFIAKLQSLALAGVQGIPSDLTEDNANIQPFIIRVHQSIVNGTTSYSFDLKAGNTPGLSIEKKLTNNDVFMLVSSALCLQKYDPAAPDFSKPLFTHPDPTYFTAAIAAQLELIYGGKMSLKAGSNNRIDMLDTSLLRYSPGANFNGTVTAPVDNPQYGPYAEDRGYFDHGIYPIIFGNETNVVEFSLAQGSTASIADTGANKNNLVYLGLGWKFLGTTSNSSCTTV